ncbi:hypothetical protein, partial [Halovibrio sp. HP20-50]|uniref:hypothetical protein n=1 Tax=Halovibrio sp. HP20-59 TaxID=3080275 RepID=UPI00294B2542
PNAVAREVQIRLRELEEDDRADRAATAAAPASEDADMPPQARDQMLATIALIARDELGVKTLHECGAGSIRAALIEAYVE